MGTFCQITPAPVWAVKGLHIPGVAEGGGPSSLPFAWAFSFGLAFAFGLALAFGFGFSFALAFGLALAFAFGFAFDLTFFLAILALLTFCGTFLLSTTGGPSLGTDDGN